MLKEEVLTILKSIGIAASIEDLEEPKEEFGDVAFPCFKLAKEQRKNPVEIAKEVAKKIPVSKHPLLLKVEARGGYVNFFFYWEKIMENILKQFFRKSKPRESKRIMVEFSQPNPVHSMHIGHARSTFLGDSLANIYELLGNKVIRANYINNVGLQVAKLVTAYLLWGKNKRPKGKPDRWLWEFYVKFHEEAKKDPSLEDRAREILKKFESNEDKKIVRVWNKLVRWCVKGFKETYKQLGIRFDVYLYEKDFRNLGKELVNKAIMKGIAFKSLDNTIVANLEKYGLPNCVMLRSDGTGLYLTSDLGMTVYKFKKYKLDEAVWVVASAQDLYFKQLFKILELLDYKWVKNCHHFSFNLVRLLEGKMSSREGRAIMLDEVIKELIRLAYDEVNKRNPKLEKRKKLKIAKIIGIGALKYSILKIEPEDTITFDWKQMLSLKGNTAPYLQYAYTRCSGILRKAKKWKITLRINKLTNEEKQLLKTLAKFNSIVKSAAKDMRPHYICNYCYELATNFDKFYEFCPVLKAEDKNVKNFRLTLVQIVRDVLKTSLNLLGIKTLERM